MWQSLFTCSACNYHSHRRCLELIRRPCASRKVSISTYDLRICPETGLSSQQYKCAECRKQIRLTKGERSEARMCDYSGQYFCEECHWNDLVVIPARVVHNWDFSTYRVSRQSKQFLALMLTRPQLKIERLNPALFKFVVELREVKRLREEILIMKKYFVTCREALESKLLLQLKDRQHFVDSANIYSLKDLIDVNSGLLLPFLTKIHSLFLTHIKSDCQLCQAKGFVCEICGKDEIIFAFDPHSTQCKDCRAVFHKICFKSAFCPKCERRQKRSHKT
ncbi:Differentially expressed in FDCP 8 [Desmophyllum pertusum]|uniref:Differentially expressed in FDCP 8 n=1 Tax=Desmophyllum pertusum TaxID=174260 RepID=A0A9X0CSR1_9CNID|nr:Differentially expressed in FDCP 8 [Desmophyllum pertusum]